MLIQSYSVRQNVSHPSGTPLDRLLAVLPHLENDEELYRWLPLRPVTSTSRMRRRRVRIPTSHNDPTYKASLLVTIGFVIALHVSSLCIASSLLVRNRVLDQDLMHSTLSTKGLKLNSVLGFSSMPTIDGLGMRVFGHLV